MRTRWHLGVGTSLDLAAAPVVSGRAAVAPSVTIDQSLTDMQPPSDARVVEIRVGLIWLAPDGLIRDVIKPGSNIDVPDCHEVLDAWREVTGGRPTPIILDITEIGSATKASRDFWKRADAVQMIPAMAIIVRSPIGRAVGNFFIRLTNPEFPTRLFTSEESAVAWAKELATS